MGPPRLHVFGLRSRIYCVHGVSALQYRGHGLRLENGGKGEKHDVIFVAVRLGFVGPLDRIPAAAGLCRRVEDRDGGTRDRAISAVVCRGCRLSLWGAHRDLEYSVRSRVSRYGDVLDPNPV